MIHQIGVLNGNKHRIVARATVENGSSTMEEVKTAPLPTKIVRTKAINCCKVSGRKRHINKTKYYMAFRIKSNDIKR